MLFFGKHVGKSERYTPGGDFLQRIITGYDRKTGTQHNFESDVIIEGSGKVITPGFIDPHAHGDPLSTPEFNNFIAQGVTTIVLGQDGSSAEVENISHWFATIPSQALQPSWRTG